MDYTLEADAGESAATLAIDDSIAAALPALIDREVRLDGEWQPENRFLAGGVRALSEGCTGNGQ